jgi:predicted NAD/FAD-binding protein
MADFDGTVHQGHAISTVAGDDGGVTVFVEGVGALHFDHAVVATHGDQALKLLARPSDQEYRVLGAFKYSANRVVLHADPRLMPRRRSAWASWNFMESADGRQGVSYWMNRLQNFSTPKPVLVTLNPPTEPNPRLTYGTYAYDHPVFDQGAMDAQADLECIQGRNGIWFCGSYFGYGFHEDAFASGLGTAARLGASIARRGVPMKRLAQQPHG